MRTARLRALASSIDPRRAPALLARFGAWGGEGGEGGGGEGGERDRAEAAALAAVVAAAHPAFETLADTRPEAFVELAREGWHAARDRAELLRRLLAAVGELSDGDLVRARLRRAVAAEKLRIAVRELLPASLGGADLDVTSAELSDLADAAIEVALAEAKGWAEARNGVPRTASGDESRFVVIGMGKLGGRELNAGSDVDLLYFYDTDDGETSGDREPKTLHEHWSSVSRRLTETLDASTEDGLVWRVDLRLRPEGSLGAIANSLPAAERYYETFGRLWERAALLRARPSAGDLALGREMLDMLLPFVYVRHVDPTVAVEMIRLVERSRAELSSDPELDLKLGRGGIREAEFFVQSLQLVWGGRDPRLRVPGMLDALRRLRARGLVTDREGREIADAYLLLRRLEHRVQWSSGIQTHLLPKPGETRARLARSMGYRGEAELERDLDRARARIANRFASLAPTAAAAAKGRWTELLAHLDAHEVEPFADAALRAFGPVATPELVRDLRTLARRPDDLLGGSTRERFPELAPTLLDALADAADPEQAARYVRTWSARVRATGAYLGPLSEDPRALRRLVGAFGASAFLAEAIANRPELGDSVIFSRTTPTPALARGELEREVAALLPDERADPDAFVGALRRGGWRTTIEVALAELAGEIELRDAMHTLSALADATLESATRFVLESPGPVRGLSVVALGKLGGEELGYGSDLDVLFVFDPHAAPEGSEAHEWFARRAQRIIRLVSSPHAEGPGYELDTRLRPSGSHGLLVTTLDSFARYHDVALPGRERSDGPSVLSSGAPWERQALVRARFCAGDPELGAAALRIAKVAAYERGAPPPAELHRLRTRLERELAHERPGRHDLKFGRGGLADVEFAAQYLQMKNGSDPRVRTTETWVALGALETLGYLRPELAEPLREGWRFLRRLEQRIRIVHGSSAHLVDEAAPGLVPLARRMGLRDGPRATAAEELVARYRDVTEGVRRAYLEVIGVGEG